MAAKLAALTAARITNWSIEPTRVNARARPLRVLQLLPAMEAGGVEKSTLEIADALIAAGHEATVISAGGRLVPALEALGATHITLDIGRKSLMTLRHVRTLRRLMANVDVVHARSRVPAWLAWFALRGMKVAPHFVTTVHGLNSPSRYSRIMTAGERVICVSNVVKAYVLRHYPETPERKLVVIPRGIDAARFPRRASIDTTARAQFAKQCPQLAGTGALLLLPGRGTRLKGHEDAIRLVQHLKAEGLSTVLWMPGAEDPKRASYVSELKTLAETLGVANQVLITPPIANIADAYAASDVVLQLSRKPESFGRTVVEALSVGAPVLGWDHGGVGEILHALFPAGAVADFNTAELVKKAKTFLDAPPALPSAIPYTLESMQDATLKVYDELQSKH